MSRRIVGDPWSAAMQRLRLLRPSEERRRHPRQEVLWPVQVSLGEDVFALGRAINASAYGLCVAASDHAKRFVEVGEVCQLHIYVEPRVMRYAGEVRNITPLGIGFLLVDDLGALLTPPRLR